MSKFLKRPYILFSWILNFCKSNVWGILFVKCFRFLLERVGDPMWGRTRPKRWVWAHGPEWIHFPLAHKIFEQKVTTFHQTGHWPRAKWWVIAATISWYGHTRIHMPFHVLSFPSHFMSQNPIHKPNLKSRQTLNSRIRFHMRET